jgi:hypothetical protein
VRRCSGTILSAVAQVDPRHGEDLLLSAFETLRSTSPEMIGAMTLSMPVKSNDEAGALQKLALQLAVEYNMRPDIAANDGHLIVRLTRQSSTDYLKRHSHDTHWLAPGSRPLRSLLAVTKPLGLCMARVFTGERTWLSPVLRPIKKGIYRASGVDERREQG